MPGATSPLNRMSYKAAAVLVAVDGAGAPHFSGRSRRRARALPLAVLLRLGERHAAGVVTARGGHAGRSVVLDELLEHLLHRRPRRRVLAGADHPEEEHRHGVLEERRPVLQDAPVDNVVQRAAGLVPPPRPLRQAVVGAAVVRHPAGRQLQQHDAEAVHVHLLVHLRSAPVLC
uniref:Uncharacterized protein n=1 Tax=Oryza brachyantha TaxID=4533 RepID=J3LB28_ORYBR